MQALPLIQCPSQKEKEESPLIFVDTGLDVKMVITIFQIGKFLKACLFTKNKYENEDNGEISKNKQQITFPIMDINQEENEYPASISPYIIHLSPLR